MLVEIHKPTSFKLSTFRNLHENKKFPYFESLFCIMIIFRESDIVCASKEKNCYLCVQKPNTCSEVFIHSVANQFKHTLRALMYQALSCLPGIQRLNKARS